MWAWWGVLWRHKTEGDEERSFANDDITSFIVWYYDISIIFRLDLFWRSDDWFSYLLYWFMINCKLFQKLSRDLTNRIMKRLVTCTDIRKIDLRFDLTWQNLTYYTVFNSYGRRSSSLGVWISMWFPEPESYLLIPRRVNLIDGVLYLFDLNDITRSFGNVLIIPLTNRKQYRTY